MHAALVEQIHVRGMQGDLWHNLTFYLTSPDTYGSALYFTLWVGVVVFLINVGRLLWRKDVDRLMRYVGYAGAVVTAYLVPTVSPLKTFYLGGIFYGTFLFFTLNGLILIFLDLQSHSLAMTRIAAATLAVVS